MIATIELPLDKSMRQQICDRMSEAMGAYIETLGRPDFGTWNAEEWARFIGVAFDVAAIAVFQRRIVVVPPMIELQEDERPPY